MRWLCLLVVGVWGSVCVDYRATGYWSNNQQINGLPPAGSASFTFLPSFLNPCDLEYLQATCINRINMYRSGSLKFKDGTSDPGVPKPALKHFTQNNRCASAMALGDLKINGGVNGCGGAHENSFSCASAAGNTGQNTCCYRTASTLPQIQNQLQNCLQMMWDEGIGLPDNAGFSGANGHWYNMRASSNVYASCGFAFTTGGGLWMNQDFFSGSSGSACACPGAGGSSDGCGGVCYTNSTTPAPVACASAYVQGGYSVSKCAAGTPDSTSCTAVCASQFAGSVTGTVSCSNGAYTGSFAGCIPYCPADQGWPATAPGTSATPQPCTAPQTGTTTRACTASGTWQSPVVSCVTPVTCSDGIQNQDETCIDCGGAVCPACDPCACVVCGLHGNCTAGACTCSGGWGGPKCDTPPDPCSKVVCQHQGSCYNGVCSCINGYNGTYCEVAPPATCSDGVLNQNESAIDCGGPCPPCPTYQWVASDWGNCSKSCGGGNQQRNAQCADQSGAIVANSNCQSLHPLDLTQTCNVDPCPTFTWITGGWGMCSSPCGTGFQTRTVQCQSSVGPSIVQSGCTESSMPASQQGCNTDVCVASRWVSLPWNPCSASCSGGTQTRTNECRDVNNELVTPDQCNATTVPTTQQSCNLVSCESYSWRPCPTFLPCTAQCNGGGSMVGVQYRDVFCIRQSDQGVVDNSLCTGAPPTTALTVCNTQKCQTFNWMANANWGPCLMDSTGKYSRNRSFHCHDASGALTTIQQCESGAGKVPIQVLPCAPGVCSDANGCPLVQIGTVFNYCNSIPADCAEGSACAVAAAALDDAFLSLGTSAVNAAACAQTYNNGLPADQQVTQSMIDAVVARLSTGQQVCDLILVSDANTPTVCLAAIVLSLIVLL